MMWQFRSLGSNALRPPRSPVVSGAPALRSSTMRANRRIFGGKTYTSIFSDIYQNKAGNCIMLVADSYAARVWTTHDCRSAQARAFQNRNAAHASRMCACTESHARATMLCHLVGNRPIERSSVASTSESIPSLAFRQRVND